MREPEDRFSPVENAEAKVDNPGGGYLHIVDKPT
jgi:hypothetical protein